MPFQLPNAVHETTTTSGTGALTLLGAVTDRKTFGSQLANGDTTMIVTTDGTDWECAIGTFTSPSTISRDTVIYSTNGNALVVWPGSGTRDVFIATPGEVFKSLIDPGMAAGFLAKTGDRTYASREIDVDTDDLQIANPAGTAGNPTLALSFTVTTFIKRLLASADLATAQASLEIQNLIDAAKLVTFAGLINSSGASDATKYYHPNGNTSDVYTSPNVVAAPSPADFTLTSFRTRLATNTFNGSLTLTVMVDGVATAAEVTYAAGETGAKSWSGSVAISAGNAIEVRFAELATTGNISQLVWAMS